MKTIVAFIRPAKEEAVREALHDVPGVTGASFSDVRGFGRGRSHEGAKDLVGVAPRVRVEVIVNDHVAEAVESAIATAAHTGHRGDGKIYVLPLATARRISTGQVGTEAV